MSYLKHDKQSKSAKKQPASATRTKSEPEYRVPTGLGGLEFALSELAGAVRDYANNATTGENMLKIFTGEEGAGYYPVLIALDPCSESTKDFLVVGERMATAFERIADALGQQKS